MSAETELRDHTDAELERDPYQAFFRLSLDMMCIASPDGYLKRVNPSFTKLSGYSEEELLETPYLEFVLPEDRQRVQDDIQKVLQGTDNNYCVEHRFTRKDGVIRQFSWQAHSGPEQGVLYATGRDITEIRATEEQLNKLWLAAQQTPLSIVITDLAARVEYANEASCRISGYTTEEMIGKNQRLLQSGQTPATTYAEMWATLKRGEVWQGEFTNRRKNGELYIESTRISPVRQPDGRITHYLAIKEDITEQKRIMDAIRESKTLLQGVIDAIPDWIYVKDRDHRFMLVNEQCAKAFNQMPADMVGRCDTDFVPSCLRFGNPDWGAEHIHNDDDAVFSGKSIHNAYDKVFFGNDETGVFETNKTPMRDSSGSICGNLCYRRDITERFNKQQEKNHLERQLHQAQKMELIGHLTGGIAHDFNNILSAVFGYAELMQLSPDVLKSPQLIAYVQEILQAGIRAKELVAQLLTFSHRKETASEAISVPPIAKEVAKLLRATLPTSISIECVLADNLPEILISPVQLHQILMNLCVNARDAMAETGTIKIEAKLVFLNNLQSCASCHLNFHGEHLMISVRDGGTGIPPENLSRIFDPFFTTKDVGRGSGLGLSVLHGIVHSANGHIEVITSPGEGTEFRVYLPPHSSKKMALPADIKPNAENSPIRGTVMVVDDEASIVRFMTELLEHLGCRVIGLTSSTEALKRFQNDPHGVDLVLTDQTMPELSGIELARTMLVCRPDIPIVLSTGYSNTIDEEKIRQVGIRRLIMKPVPSKVLADIVGEYLTHIDRQSSLTRRV